MKFYIDENMPIQVVNQLQGLYFEHEFIHPNISTELNLDGMGDKELFQYLSENDYTAIITQDLNQMKRLDEVQAMVESALHWIGIGHPKFGGVQRTAFICAGVSFVLGNFIEGNYTEAMMCVAKLPAHNQPNIKMLADHIDQPRKWKSPQI